MDRYRPLEAARLDQLQPSLWDRALGGDVAAVAQVRRIIETGVACHVVPPTSPPPLVGKTRYTRQEQTPRDPTW